MLPSGREGASFETGLYGTSGSEYVKRSGGICKNGGHAVFNGKFSFYGTVDCRRNGSDTGAVSGVGFDAGKAGRYPEIRKSVSVS